MKDLLQMIKIELNGLNTKNIKKNKTLTKHMLPVMRHINDAKSIRQE